MQLGKKNSSIFRTYHLNETLDYHYYYLPPFRELTMYNLQDFWVANFEKILFQSMCPF